MGSKTITYFKSWMQELKRDKLAYCLGVLVLFNVTSLKASSVEGDPEQVTISGTVISSEDQQPIPGVNVVLLGTTNGTSTDMNGEYTITVPAENSTLVFTAIGFAKQEIGVNGRTTINVTLNPSVEQLDEAVVIGYGEQKRATITGSVATLKTDNFKERPITRVDQGLVGQLAGVRVKQTSGLPGQPFSINIRGAGSISGNNEPLYVIDGFPVITQETNSNGGFSDGSPLDNINPNDIESIEILKDASAGAIYGSRAANGVVLITTKKGRTRKPRFNVNTSFGVTNPVKKLDMLTAEEWIQRSKDMIDTRWERSAVPGADASQSTAERIALYNDFVNNGGSGSIVDPNDYETYAEGFMYDPRWDMEGHPGLDYIDWQDRMFRTGNFQNYQLSASGMTDAVNYYVSGNYQNTEGYIIGTDYELFSLRANFDAKLSDRMKIGVNIAPSYSIRKDPGVEGKDAILHKMTSNTPVFPSDVNESGDQYTQRYKWGSSGTDRLDRLEEYKADNTLFRTLMTAYASYNILDNLTFKSTINFDNFDGTYEGYTPSANLTSIRGAYNTYRKQTIVNENTLNYNTTIGENHNLNLLAGHAYNRYQIMKSSLSSGNRYNNFSTQTLPGNSTGSTNASRTVMISYFGRAQYDFKEKYLVSASLRRDGSSRFGSNSQWGTFASGSAGWRISEEDFFQDIKPTLSELKIRASYGASGSDGIGAYAWSPNMGTYNYYFDGLVQGQGVATSPNDDLHWEQSNSFNVGLDFGVLNNRITGSVDYFIRNTSDLLLNVPTVASSGFLTQLSNVGKVRNNGLEAEIRSYNLVGDFSWNTSVNLTTIKNEVVALGPDQDRIEIGSGTGGNSWALLQVGLPMYSINVIQQDGVITQSDLDNYESVNGEAFPTYNNATPYVGDPKYVDQNGDGVIDSDDRVVVGNPYPNFMWGITNNFSYKNFDLSVLVQGQAGGYIYSLLNRALNRTGMSSGENTIDVDPAERGNWLTSYGFVHNTDWLYKSDYVSLRNITLGYNATNLFNKSQRIERARFYVSGENLLYWTSYTGGWNPEATNYSGSSDGNFPVPADYGGAPVARSVVFGVNLTFN